MIVNKQISRQAVGSCPFCPRLGAFAGLLGLLLFGMGGGPVLAGTIRHDRDDALYTSLAALPQYDCAGMVGLPDGKIGSGALIASQYVLTAGHMVGDGATFTVNGTVYESQGYWRHPQWDQPGDGWDIDVGIFQLSTPAVGVAPAAFYEPAFASEVGLDGTMVGFGYTGTGLSGELAGTAGTKRAGQNRIDATGTFSNWDWSPYILLVDFDSPDGRNNTMGSKTPLDLEMGPAHGDSGCGLFVELDGRTYLAGVQCRMWYLDGADDADYGDGGVFVSVRQTFDWMQSIIDPLPGDANRDSVVDEADAALLAANWRAYDAGWSGGDFNGDGIIDEVDATIMAANWQAARTLQLAVPEPDITVLAAGMLFCWSVFTLLELFNGPIYCGFSP